MRRRSLSAPSSTRTTIVVVNHDYGRYIADAVQSVAHQTVVPRLLVVDDGSSDETVEVLPRLQAAYPWMECVRIAQPIGLSRVRNHAAALAASEWIVFLDADDWLAPTYVEHAEAWLAAHPDTDVLTPDMTIVSANGCTRVRRASPPRYWDDLLRRNGVVQTSFIRRSLIQRLGGYDPALEFEDWDFWIRVVQAGGRIDRLPGAYVFWRDHGRNKSKVCAQEPAASAVRRKHQRLWS